jgi:adenylosuccinate synthase
MGIVQVVVDGQYGSTGKGAVCAHLAAPDNNPAGLSAVRVAGPNAGHSAVDPTGRKWPLRQIPVAAVIDPRARLYIAAGSEIDPDVLGIEISELEAAGYDIRSRLTIDAMATVIDPVHKRVEADASLVERIGSTGKGIGAARADRIMRRASAVRDTYLADLYHLGDTAALMRQDLGDDRTVQIEGTQGYGLGLHHPNYPQVTSSNCRAMDFLAMAGISPWDTVVDDLEIWLVFRPYPIRVAGNSGPLLGETTWAGLGLPEERTTVTNKVRRVGHWDPALARAAVYANGGPSENLYLALTMADQLDPSIAGVTTQAELEKSEKVLEFLDQVDSDCDQAVSLVGTSDRTAVRL